MSAPTTDRDALSALCLSYLKPPRHGGSWTLNPDALADAIIATGWVKPVDTLARLELVELIAGPDPQLIAEDIIAAGWVQPKILRTFADVQANPKAIFRDTGGYVGEIQEYLTLADGDDWYWTDQLPITVLWEPQP